jgi:hypothetical protein
MDTRTPIGDDVTDSSMVPAGSGGLTMNFGSTQLDATDFVPPRVKILQPMSAETTDGAAPGDWYNTLTQENYGPTMRVVPITPLKQRVLLVREAKKPLIDALLAAADISPMPEGEGLMCRSLDMVVGIGHPGDVLAADSEGCPHCPLSRWRGQEPPPCTETYNIVAVEIDRGDLVILSMAKSGAKTGKQFFSLLMLTKGAPWMRAYDLSTVEMRNSQGKFWVPRVKVSPEPPPTDIMREAARWYPQFTGRVVDITATASITEDTNGSDDTDALNVPGAAF